MLLKLRHVADGGWVDLEIALCWTEATDHPPDVALKAESHEEQRKFVRSKRPAKYPQAGESRGLAGCATIHRLDRNSGEDIRRR